MTCKMAMAAMDADPSDLVLMTALQLMGNQQQLPASIMAEYPVASVVIWKMTDIPGQRD